MIKQKTIEICGVTVPVIVEDGVEYYPISYLSEKVLLRKGNSIINKDNYIDYKHGLKAFEIQYGDKNTQLTRCISKHYLIKRLNQTQVARLNDEQKRNQNQLHKHLGIEMFSLKPVVIKKSSKITKSDYDDYTYGIIAECLKEDSDWQFQLCSKCDKYFPMINKFFRLDNRVPSGFSRMCLVCEGKVEFFKSEDSELNKVRKLGEEYYQAFTKDNVIKIYEAYIDGRLKHLPDCYSNKESYLEIIRWLLDTQRVKLNELTIKNLIKQHGLSNMYQIYKINDLHFTLFGEDSFYYPWKYPCIQRGKDLGIEITKKIFDNYLMQHNIIVEDKYNYDFSSAIHKAKIRVSDILEFVVQYYGHSDPGYKYGVKGNNYYKKEENLLFDLRYLIEKDMQLEVEKIPLYLTKTSLRTHASPLYTYIVANQNGSICEWVDRLYPDNFTPYDFDINYYRDNFDSIEESQIHEILTDTLENVIYNARNTKRTITIEGMLPDWIVIGKEKCWFIEYFGMYTDRGGYNSRTSSYVEKTDTKINKYENELSHYGKVYLYPDDLKDNFTGVREKIKVIR